MRTHSQEIWSAFVGPMCPARMSSTEVDITMFELGRPPDTPGRFVATLARGKIMGGATFVVSDFVT